MPLLQSLDLGQENRRIDHHTRADQVHRRRVQDARRHDVQDRRLAVHHEGVAGVVAALEARDEIGARREPVDDLALSLVAPLGADCDDGRHLELFI